MKDFTKMSVEEIRAELIDLGLTKDEVDSIKGKTNLVEKYKSLEGSELDNPVEESTSEIVQEILSQPKRTDAGWHDYVMGLFLPDETVESPKDRNVRLPTVDGLRRVAELVVGEIVESIPKVVKGCTQDDKTATVEYLISFYNNGATKVFGGVADSTTWNADSAFARYPAANAETRAEARALRKALGLKKIVSVEEIVGEDKEDSFEPLDPATDIQWTLLDKLCKQNDIDLIKYINYGKQKYGSYAEVTKNSASMMIKWINVL